MQPYSGWLNISQEVIRKWHGCVGRGEQAVAKQLTATLHCGYVTKKIPAVIGLE